MTPITRRSRDIQELMLIPNISRSVADRSHSGRAGVPPMAHRYWNSLPPRRRMVAGIFFEALFPTLIRSLGLTYRHASMFRMPPLNLICGPLGIL
jgi:hypothetical protein